MTKIELAGYEIVGVRAPNPGAFTLSGTNTWIIGRVSGWLIDPGPAIDSHLRELSAELVFRPLGASCSLNVSRPSGLV